MNAGKLLPADNVGGILQTNIYVVSEVYSGIGNGLSSQGGGILVPYHTFSPNSSLSSVAAVRLFACSHLLVFQANLFCRFPVHELI